MSTPAPAVGQLSAPLPATRRIAIVRAVVALIWAGALAIAVGDDVPTTASDLPTLVALLLTAYPLIDATASLIETAGPGAHDDVLRLGAAISTLAAVALGVATFASDAGAAVLVFGVWAFASGAVQLTVALRRRRAAGGQMPLIVSGALSAIAGVTFAAASTQDSAHVANLAGYAALGAVFYLVWAARAHRVSNRI